MKKKKYYTETSALLHESFQRRQKYFVKLCESFNILLDFYDVKTIREQIYLMMLDFSEAERDGMSAKRIICKRIQKK